MQNKTKKKRSKSVGVPSRSRSTAEKGIKGKQPAARLGKLQRAENIATVRPVTAFTLKPLTKQLPALLVYANQNRPAEFASDESQLQAIKDLYPVVSKLKGYKENKRWTENTRPSEILHNLLNVVDDEFNETDQRDAGWNFKKEGDKFILEVCKTWGDSSAIFIPLDFLSQINRSHKKLHDFIVYALILVKSYNRIQLFYDWCQWEKRVGAWGMFYEHLIERQNNMTDELDEVIDDESYDPPYSNEDLNEIGDTLDYYGPNGIPNAYLKLFNSGASLRHFKKQLDAFIPSNQLERIALPFLQLAYKLAATKVNINDYCLDPWQNGIAMPRDYFVALWTTDKDDLMYDAFTEFLDDQAQNIGESGFCWKCELDNAEKIDKAIEWCKLATSFFEVGRDMADKIKDKVKKVKQEYPLPLKTKPNKNARLVNKFI